MNINKNKSFLKLTVLFGLVFLVVVTILKIIFSMIMNGGISEMINQYFSATTWQLFAKTQLVMSALYGALMAGYYKFIKK